MGSARTPAATTPAAPPATTPNAVGPPIPTAGGPPATTPTTVAARRAARAAATRAVPQRSEAFAHLSLEALRAHRRALTEEEGRVSYWRRVLQARLDLVRSGEPGRLDPEVLRPALAETRPGARRQVALDLVADPGHAPLPDLAALWEREAAPEGPAREALVAALEQADADLSAYRSSLHARLGAATGELIARYHEQPTLCLSVLPLGPHG